jgi:predicted GTPase
MKPRRAIIMGAAGRDFHNFNVFFRDNPDYQVVAFTAAQIPDIQNRAYPKELAGPAYPEGIPIRSETELAALIRETKADVVILSYSDLAHVDVMHKASLVGAAGADFMLLGMRSTCLQSTKPVISICAVRTGAGKSPTSRYIHERLSRAGLRVAVVRHPMPYGKNLVAQEVQRFSSYADFEKYDSTIEEMEEYEPYVRRGVPIFAGVDYEKVLREAEKNADVILWDGGNNDLPFFFPDLHIVVADPHRAGQELTYYPGEANFRAADVVLIGKTGNAKREDIETVRKHAHEVNPAAQVIQTDLDVSAVNGEAIRGKKVLVIEDGPSVTHGDMSFGAASIVAERYGASVVDASKYAVGSLADIYKTFPHLHKILPAMGYSDEQKRELQETIDRAKVRYVVTATPIDLKRLLHIDKTVIEVGYSLVPSPELNAVLAEFVMRHRKAA